ncbi:MAG: Calx-beta domain-containing protein, partial [Calothrix sp. MO_192.B10]|nr:Calx-beta domain-containing protein [Calothrix sp. MO_192.B10]
AYEFFSGLPDGGTNIAYFLSDGQSSDNFSSSASALQSLADVQAYGIGYGADIAQLNIVDSNNALALSNPSDLTAEFDNSEFSADNIAKINLLLDGTVVETIQSSQLIEDSLGLSFAGSVENLDVSLGAENLITAEIFFTDGTPTSTVDFTIASGLQATTGDNPFDNIVDGTAGDDTIRLGAIDLGSNSGAGNDKVVGNDLDNILDSGSGDDIVFGNDGNDTIISGNGQNRIDGGDGIDTVVYGNKSFPDSSIQKVGQVITVDNIDTLTNVEFIQFSDTRIGTDFLQPVPILTASNITIDEGNSSNTTAQFIFNLSSPSSTDVEFTYSTLNGSAIADEDYIATSGQVLIAKGETTATVEVEIVADTQLESAEIFALNLSGLSGASFENNQSEYSAIATIETDTLDDNEGVLDDNIYGSGDAELVDGGGGNDHIYGNGGMDTLIGGAGNDNIYGSGDAELIDGGSGDDNIYGNGGADLINSGSGFDSVFLSGVETTIVLETGEGFDTIYNFQLGATKLEVSSLDNLTFANSEEGGQIFLDNDLLAVVAHQSANTFSSNQDTIFTV